MPWEDVRRVTMRSAALLAAVLVLVAGVAAVPALAQETTTTVTDGDEGDAPGAQLAGVVGVQEAEIEGELESRSFEIALNRSGGDASNRAGVIASQVSDLEARLEELRQRKDELDRAREKGNITQGEYRARIAGVGTRIATVQRLANQTANATQGIPDETLRERGVDANAIRELRQNARNLSGPEVAAIARGIAGPGAGKGLGGGPPANRTHRGEGPPGNGNGQADGPPGNDDGQSEGPPGNGDGRPGSGSPAAPGSNASNNGSDGAKQGPPGDGPDGPAMDEPGNETASGNGTEPDVPDGGETSDDRTVTDDGEADAGQIRDDAVVRTDGATVMPSADDYAR